MPKTDHGLGPVHHYGYLVADLEPAAKSLADQFGAGPFFTIPEVPLENLTSAGEPAEFRHASAFGVWNGQLVELMQIAGVSPARVAAAFELDAPRVHHLAWAAPSEVAEAARQDFEKRSLPAYLHAHLGDIDFTYHDAKALLGHDVEIHVDGTDFREFFVPILAAAEDWDGTEPVRPMFS